jgi:hypothetical protein
MKKPIVIVTDHAVLRYLERVMLVDVESLRCRIGQRVDRAVAAGASAVIVEGFRYALREGYVTTVLEASTPDVRTGRQRREREE